MSTFQRWTQTDITELRSRLEVGGTVADIAETFQRPVENIRAMMSRLRLRART
jgi:hypothetical protein